VQYLGMPRGVLRTLLLAGWVPSLVLVGALLLGVTVPFGLFRSGALVAYLVPMLLAFRRAFEQPGDGHAALGVALLSLPLLPFVMAVFGVEGMQLRYFSGLTVTVFGAIVLAVSLLRRHRALAAEVRRRADAETKLRTVNSQLEARVVQRTAHLRELIGGLEAFNRGVSHDLRGPLGGMSQLARLAAEALGRGDASLAQRALPTIAGQCDASVRMLGAMLDLARLGDAKARRETVELADVAQAAYDEVLLSLPDSRVTFDIGPAPPMRADPDLLRTVFVNLFANAVKFTRGVEAPRIAVEIELSGPDATVCVRDNGIGFEAENAARLFEPFYRAHDARYEGHGLGLSIVRRAVQAMGGTVRAQAVEGGGARLCFTLPGAVTADAGAALA